MNNTRRHFLQNAALLGASIFTTRNQSQLVAQTDRRNTQSPPPSQLSPPTPAATGYLPVVTPDVPDLPFEIVNGAKVFHLIAEPVRQQILPGKTTNLWGYNGSAPGPTIQIRQGDRVRIIVDNHLPEPTSMHWHGFDIPNRMDGMPGLTQEAIAPGGRYIYEFTLEQEGTYFYHSHMAMQEMMGMMGAFIMHPREAYHPPVDKDFLIALQEYAILPGNQTPNSMSMEFNWLTFNGKTGPAATPLIVHLGERVRLRFINLGMDHHPIHLHGHQFVITGTEGGRQPQGTWGPNNTVLVGVAQARDVEFVANNPGNWMIHCHLPHHMMNQMSSTVGPMTRRFGMPAGAGIEQGMGIMLQGSATSPENGPSMGRAMGVGSKLEQPRPNGPLNGQSRTEESQQPRVMQMDQIGVSANANSIPGFPQDAFMEGPPMAMDAMVQKPENYGLPAGWSGYMQGMMTLIRVLPDAEYNQIMELRAKQKSAQQPQMPTMKESQHE
jgi:FtsP/CotA-like multicopper oxidase with cupredoxin domain